LWHLSLAIGEELERTHKKKKFQRKVTKFIDFTLPHCSYPGNVTSNLRLTVQLATCQNDVTVPKRKTMRTPSLLHNVFLQGMRLVMIAWDLGGNDPWVVLHALCLASQSLYSKGLLWKSWNTSGGRSSRQKGVFFPFSFSPLFLFCFLEIEAGTKKWQCEFVAF